MNSGSPPATPGITLSSGRFVTGSINSVAQSSPKVIRVRYSWMTSWKTRWPETTTVSSLSWRSFSLAA